MKKLIPFIPLTSNRTSSPGFYYYFKGALLICVFYILAQNKGPYVSYSRFSNVFSRGQQDITWSHLYKFRIHNQADSRRKKITWVDKYCSSHHLLPIWMFMLNYTVCSVFLFLLSSTQPNRSRKSPGVRQCFCLLNGSFLSPLCLLMWERWVSVN